MLKRNWKTLLITSLLTLAPIVIGLIFWNKLPDTMTTHWDINGNPDGWSGKGFAISIVPLLCLGMHWFCILVTVLALGKNEQNEKAFRAVLWTMPIISIITSGQVYSAGLEYTLDWVGLFPAGLGLIFMILGNYLPKCTRNNVIGIKVLWALTDDENWNATHRFAGKLWFWGGALCMLCGLLPMNQGIGLMCVILMVVTFGSVLYSYLYYRKQLKNGRAPVKSNPAHTRITWIIIAATLVLLYVVLFTGDIQMVYSDTYFIIEASRWSDRILHYDRIDTIAYSDTPVSGTRTNGYGSPRLLMGSFHNEEVGYYTRYTYTQCDANVQVWANGQLLVLSGKDEAATREIYEELKERIGQCK